MARQFRLPLLLVLAALTIAFVAKPTPALAFTPYCTSGIGHYYHCDNIDGWRSSYCGAIQFCTVGHLCYEWDCADDGNGNIVPGDPVTPGPQMCYCGYYGVTCCG